VQDGTFTISNLGMYGIHSFTAIINPPQTAILAVGTVKHKPVVIDEADTVEVRPMMMMTLAADHRVIDGAVAAAFLSELVKALETPELMLI
jgi:pyruvate dehydrogenase E2 component (dihydrolipoamide acetyltransferase)